MSNILAKFTNYLILLRMECNINNFYYGVSFSAVIYNGRRRRRLCDVVFVYMTVLCDCQQQNRSRAMAASSSSEATSSASVSIKQEVVERDSPLAVPAVGAGDAAAVAAAAAAAVVQRHLRLGLSAASPSSSSLTGRRSALSYSLTPAGSRAARMHSTAQPETCVCEVSLRYLC